MSAKDIRNIVLLGHGGSGKTTLAESMLFMTGGTDRFGKVTDGNTTCDYDAEEIKRNISISLAVAPVKYKNVKINVLDTPGNFDFAGEVLSGIRAAECAVLVCGAKDGLSVGAERAWKMLGNKPRMIFINRTDEENSDYNACFDALKGKVRHRRRAHRRPPSSTAARRSPASSTCCTTRPMRSRAARLPSAPFPPTSPTRSKPCVPS